MRVSFKCLRKLPGVLLHPRPDPSAGSADVAFGDRWQFEGVQFLLFGYFGLKRVWCSVGWCVGEAIPPRRLGYV